MKKEEEPNVLNRNMKLLVQAYRLQCEKKFEESFKVIQKSWKIMEKLAELADSQPQMQQMLNTNREIIPNSLFLKKFEKKMENNENAFENRDLSEDNPLSKFNFILNDCQMPTFADISRKKSTNQSQRAKKKRIIKPGELINDILRKEAGRKKRGDQTYVLADNENSFILQQRALLLKKKAKKVERNKWTDTELKKLKDGIKIYGKKDVKNLSFFVESRKVSQIRSKIQKIELKKRQAQKNHL